MDRKVLQNRLVIFSVDTSKLSGTLKTNPAGNNMAQQLAKSGTSPALNYAESQSAESTKDFIHKLTIALKELRETSVCLAIIEDCVLSSDKKLLSKLKSECNELEAIFVSSLKTLSQKQNN